MWIIALVIINMRLNLEPNFYPQRTQRMNDTGQYNQALLEAMSSLTSITTKSAFIEWTRNKLQPAFPHNAFAGWVGKLDAAEVLPFEVVCSNLPDEYIESIKTENGHYTTPLMKRWLHSGQPQLFELDKGSQEFDRIWLEAFKAADLRNTASYGAFDITGRYVTYFSFYRLQEPLGEWHQLQLKIIMPSMHSTLLVIRNQNINVEQASDRSPLTPREREVLVWICEGKTSDEIASILGISFKTVENHAQNVLEKLNVHNRAQAAAKAYQLKLVRVGPRLADI
ncbi:hypothetical protein CAP31_06230 [Sulfuriferula sp. AH1]|nr:hypothetical protein CAP31_06230 [Sulfuriferula sp. AH1]